VRITGLGIENRAQHLQFRKQNFTTGGVKFRDSGHHDYCHLGRDTVRTGWVNISPNHSSPIGLRSCTPSPYIYITSFPCSPDSSTLKKEIKGSPETLEDSTRLHGVTSQETKTEIFNSSLNSQECTIYCSIDSHTTGGFKLSDNVTPKIIYKFMRAPPNLRKSAKSAVLHTVAGPYQAVRWQQEPT
jgi:hypothetical protein